MSAVFREIVVNMGFRTILLCLAFATPVLAADIDNGRRVYDTYCTSCHGVGGRLDPASPIVRGLGVTPADFSDPLFNSREPAADWQMVIKYGGHALGLAEQMPAQGEALSDEQIDDATAYLKSLVDTSAYPPGEMNLMLPIRTKKAFPEDEVVYIGSGHPGTRARVGRTGERVGRS
jgi:mono/diheme cytochrome c family protein